jgi:hypothetical protein
MYKVVKANVKRVKVWKVEVCVEGGEGEGVGEGSEFSDGQSD